MFPSYRNQSVDLHIYDGTIGRERVNKNKVSKSAKYV